VIKLSANLSKKVPMPDVEFSSQQFGASLEIEVADAADAQEIAQKLQGIYGLLEKSIDQQITAASGRAPQPTPAPRRSFLSEGNGNGNGNGRSNGNGGNGNGRRNGHASPAQVKAVFAISKDKGMSRDDIVDLLKAEYGVERPDDLDVRQASDLIGKLQRLEGARR
jgi:hypothetical protein